MAYNLTTLRSTAAWSTTSPKFGSHSLSGGTLINSGADTFLSATGVSGGALTTGTIEAWIKTTQTGTKIWAGHDNWYWIGVASGKATFHYGNGGTEQTVTGTTTVNDGNWHHVAAVFSSGAGSLYVDGVRDATSANTKSTGTSTQNTFTLGGFGDASLASFDWVGNIDEVRISSIARYTGSTYTTPTAAFTDDTDTVALYHLDNNGNDSHSALSANILPNDSAITYSPYNWLVSSSVAETINSGAYFKTMIAGTATVVTLMFDMTNVSSPVPQIAYRIDNGGWQQTAVAATVGLTLPSGNTWTVHTLEVVVKSTTETVNRWNSPRNASVKFTGISTTPGTCTASAVRSRALKLLVLGDSITEGVRTLNSGATNDTDRNDATVGWAWRLGENLGAEVGCVGFGGTGLSVTGSGNVPVIGTFYANLWSGQSRDLSTTPPDVVVINIGANDSTTNTVSACTTFLNNLLSATPATTKILVMRPFNGTQASNLQSAIAACNSQARVKYVDTTSWWSTSDSSDSLHPYGYINVGQLSPRLAQTIRDQLAFGNLYLNVASTAVGVAVRV